MAPYPGRSVRVVNPLQRRCARTSVGRFRCNRCVSSEWRSRDRPQSRNVTISQTRSRIPGARGVASVPARDPRRASARRATHVLSAGRQEARHQVGAMRRRGATEPHRVGDRRGHDGVQPHGLGVACRLLAGAERELDACQREERVRASQRPGSRAGPVHPSQVQSDAALDPDRPQRIARGTQAPNGPRGERPEAWVEVTPRARPPLRPVDAVRGRPARLVRS